MLFLWWNGGKKQTSRKTNKRIQNFQRKKIFTHSYSFDTGVLHTDITLEKRTHSLSFFSFVPYYSTGFWEASRVGEGSFTGYFRLRRKKDWKGCLVVCLACACILGKGQKRRYFLDVKKFLLRLYQGLIFHRQFEVTR